QLKSDLSIVPLSSRSDAFVGAEPRLVLLVTLVIIIIASAVVIIILLLLVASGVHVLLLFVVVVHGFGQDGSPFASSLSLQAAPPWLLDDSASWREGVSDWAVDYRAPGGVDGDGWQYARDFPFTYHAHKGMTDYVRRRRWFSICSAKVKRVEGFVGGACPAFLDLQQTLATSLLAFLDFTDPVAWLMGVSYFQGTSWVHVAAEQQFESISLGAGLRLWAVGRDGSAYFRNGITLNNPTGSAWFHVEPPPGGSPLVQVSVGQTAVCAVDASGKLWRRLEVMEFFPEGTEWALVSANVRSVSVGPSDQIWAVVDVVLNRRNILHRVLARREGVTIDNPVGTHWESGFGICNNINNCVRS
ncbi:hypothetical protein HPB47_005434, partial [Ixodes persulcatus]